MSDLPIVLTFEQPTRPLSINEGNRLHWAERRRRLQPWALCTAAAYRQEPRTGEPVPVLIRIELTFARAGRRDPHNYTGTQLKTIVDALVREGLVPDDDASWVSVADPLIRIAQDNRATVIIERREP